MGLNEIELLSDFRIIFTSLLARFHLVLLALCPVCGDDVALNVARAKTPEREMECVFTRTAPIVSRRASNNAGDDVGGGSTRWLSPLYFLFVHD